MKQLTKLSRLLTVICMCLSLNSSGQGVMGKYKVTDPVTTGGGVLTTEEEAGSQAVMAKNGMTAAPHNYKTFTAAFKNRSAAALKANQGYANHPEAGLLFPGTPCDKCYELIDKRTEVTKTFEKEDRNADGSKEIMVQTSNMPMHYRDAAGNWRTIRSQLQPAGKGIYAATEQEVPVTINTNAGDKFSSLGKPGVGFKFNHNLELVFKKTDGTEQSLGVADWSNHTAGDEGMYVTNAWPGVDIEMHTVRNAIKTNFVINHAMPAYADGKLLVRDHLQMDNGLALVATEGTKTTKGTLEVRSKNGIEYLISVAAVYQHNDLKNTVKLLEYTLGDHNVLDISLPGSYLNQPAAAYPVIIDPLVSLATATAPPVNGCSYNALWTAATGCLYTNAAMTPINCTVTDIQFSFEYTSTCAMEYVGFSFYKGTCRNPGTAAGGLSWSCGPIAGLSPGTCTSGGGAAYSIFSDMAACLPAPSCASIALNIKMYFYQNWLTTGACATTYAAATAPLIITVIGHTVELTGAGVTGSPLTICAGQTVTLTANGTYGVPPYTYSWLPGPVAGSPASVTPAATTTYTLTVTDACGITTGGNITVNVNPTSPINGTLTVCQGNTTTLTDATAGGTWTSGTTSVATVIPGTGVVSGVSTGTSVITYTTPAGCKAFATVTVTPLPSAITGTPVVCAGSTTSLTDATTGVPWSSSSPAIATVSPTGVVTGVAAGTATITCGTGGCIATIVVTVNATPHIAGTSFTNPTTCNGTDGTITLSGLNAGASYSVHYTSPTGPVTITISADATGNVIITGLGGGNYSAITVTNSFGCTSNSVGPMLLVAAGNPPAPSLTNSSPICAGGTVNFTGTGVAGVTYHWTGPNGFTSTQQNPTLTAATLAGGGTYSATVTLSGCTSTPATTIVTINPVPVIVVKSSADPSICQGTDGTITLTITGMPGTVTYNVAYTFNGVAASASYTSNVSGDLTITGLSQGTYDVINVTTAAGCTSNTVGPVTLTDPSAPPPPTIKSNSPCCVGHSLSLLGDDMTLGGTYKWTFPNGATSTLQDPVIAVTTTADQGNYILSYDVANCISTTSEYITLYPPITLVNVTPNTAIKYGSSIQLNADGALDYWWQPNNGSLNNPNINNPIATPTDSTTYTVIGTSQWGCVDTAYITVTIINPSPVVIPTAFTPNGDGLNDVFRIGNLTYQKLVEFSVYNRWGQVVYHNNYDPKEGWDGSFNGVIQDMGVYSYIIILANTDGPNTIYKGDVTLIK